MNLALGKVLVSSTRLKTNVVHGEDSEFVEASSSDVGYSFTLSIHLPPNLRALKFLLLYSSRWGIKG